MGSRTYSMTVTRPYLVALDASLPPSTDATTPMPSASCGNRLRSHSCWIVFLSSLACIAAVGVLVSVCSRILVRNNGLHTLARRLSAGNSDERGLGSFCGSDALEEAAWLDPTGESDVSLFPDTPEQPIRAGRGLHESKSPLEALQEVVSAQLTSITSASTAPPWPVLVFLPSIWIAERSPQEIQAAEALLQLSMSTSALEESDAATGQRIQGAHQLSASAQPTENGGLLQSQQSGSAHAGAGPLVVLGRGPGGRPLSVDADSCNHLFCRLPAVDRSKLTRKFDLTAALRGSWAAAKPGRLLSKAHSFLAKPSLTPVEMEELTSTAERLCAYMAYEQAPLQSAPKRCIAEYLGLRFLFLDVVVSTLQLLGQAASGQWWEKVVRGIPHSFPCQPAPIQGMQAKPEYSEMLIRELSSALQVLKTGQRPVNAELIRLKRLLFCSELSPKRFRSNAFSIFRNADKQSCGPKGFM